MYHRFDEKPVYQHQDANIDGALWHIPSQGWLIGSKRDIGHALCLMFARVQDTTLKIESLLEVKQWVQSDPANLEFVPVDIEISEVKEFVPRTLPSVSEGSRRDSNEVRIQWKITPSCSKHRLTQTARFPVTRYSLSPSQNPMTQQKSTGYRL
jgi:hypothetical protein